MDKDQIKTAQEMFNDAIEKKESIFLLCDSGMVVIGEKAEIGFAFYKAMSSNDEFREFLMITIEAANNILNEE